MHGRLPQPLERKYNAGCIFKRAQGDGRITAVEGLDTLLAEYGEHVVVRRPAAGRRPAPRLAGHRRSATAWSSSATPSCSG